MTAITMDEAIMKKRLPTGVICCDGSTDRIASFVTSTSSASVGVTKMLTRKTAATPLKPAASPASGCRPRLWNAAAASGTRTR
jgi:hypothetical protein